MISTHDESHDCQMSPERIAHEHLVATLLAHRITELSQEALQDLVSLGPELANCQDHETYAEIAETVREILFPQIIGKVSSTWKREKPETAKFAKHAQWVANRIKEEREKAGMTQDQLAEKSGIPQSHVSRLETGLHSPSRKTLERISAALGKQLSDFDPSTWE